MKIKGEVFHPLIMAKEDSVWNIQLLVFSLILSTCKERRGGEGSRDERGGEKRKGESRG